MVEIYPLTIVADRYGGTYSGGKYLAFNISSEDLVEDIHGDDVTCANFWNDANKNMVGFGDTIEKALEDLQNKINNIPN